MTAQKPPFAPLLTGLLAGLFALPAPSAMAGYIVTFNDLVAPSGIVRGPAEQVPCVTTHQYEAPRLRIDMRCQNPADNFHAAFDLSKGTGWAARDADKTYVLITPDAINGTPITTQQEQVNQQMAKLKDMLAKMAPEQRKAIEDSIKQQTGGIAMDASFSKPSATKTEEVKKIQGMSCTVWTVKSGPNLIQTMCLAGRGQNTTLDGLYQSFAPYKEQMKKFNAKNKAYLDMFGDTDEWFTIETQNYLGRADKQPTRSSALDSIREGAVQPHIFELPAGYRKAAVPVISK